MTQHQEQPLTEAGSAGCSQEQETPIAEQPLGYFIYHHCTDTMQRIASFLLSHPATTSMGQSLEAIVQLTREAPMRDHPRFHPRTARCPLCQDLLITQVERFNNLCITCKAEAEADSAALSTERQLHPWKDVILTYMRATNSDWDTALADLERANEKRKAENEARAAG